MPSQLDPRLHDTNPSPYDSYKDARHPSIANVIRLPPPTQQLQHQSPTSERFPLHHDGSPSSYATRPGPASHNQPSHPNVDRNHDESAAAVENGDAPGDPKKPRACEACRGLKVRCESDAANLTGACLRCAKAGRQCIVTYPTRKRQKKTDSRVAELEKKIDALTASLQATKQGPNEELHNGSSRGSPGGERSRPDERRNGAVTLASAEGAPEVEGRPLQSDDRHWMARPGVQITHQQEQVGPEHRLAGQKRRRSDDYDGEMGPAPHRSAGATGLNQGSMAPYSKGGHALLMPINNGVTKRPSVVSTTSSSSQTLLAGHEYADAIDRKLLDAASASEMFDHYVRNMAPHLPAVVFPAGTAAAEIRRTKPTLFLAILNAAAIQFNRELQRNLNRELMRDFAERILVKGEKSLDLIQALQISVLWHQPPEHQDEMKIYQLVHISAVMALDMGLGKRAKSSRGKPWGLWADHPCRRKPMLDPQSLEARRTWLGCYFLCAK